MGFNIDLSEKIVVITGVSSGIGAAIAKSYASANAKIAGCALERPDDPKVKCFFKNVENESGNTPLYIQADITRESSLKGFIDRVINHYGTVNILASNAGTNIYKGATNCTIEDWKYNMNLNLESHWNISRLCKPFLEREKNGIIIINSSCHAFSSLRGSFPYNIAKTGLKALVQSLTLEWGPDIRTVGVAPGFIDTSLSDAWFSTFEDPIAQRRTTIDSFPLKRLGTAEEIGGWFVFLSSKYANFAGGQTYLIDGGKSAMMI